MAELPVFDKKCKACAVKGEEVRMESHEIVTEQNGYLARLYTCPKCGASEKDVFRDSEGAKVYHCPGCGAADYRTEGNNLICNNCGLKWGKNDTIIGWDW